MWRGVECGGAGWSAEDEVLSTKISYLYMLFRIPSLCVAAVRGEGGKEGRGEVEEKGKVRVEGSLKLLSCVTGVFWWSVGAEVSVAVIAAVVGVREVIWRAAVPWAGN